MASNIIGLTFGRNVFQIKTFVIFLSPSKKSSNSAQSYTSAVFLPQPVQFSSLIIRSLSHPNTTSGIRARNLSVLARLT